LHFSVLDSVFVSICRVSRAKTELISSIELYLNQLYVPKNVFRTCNFCVLKNENRISFQFFVPRYAFPNDILLCLRNHALQRNILSVEKWKKKSSVDEYGEACAHARTQKLLDSCFTSLMGEKSKLFANVKWSWAQGQNF